MSTDVVTFASWLADAHVAEDRLSDPQRHVLQAAFHFRQHCGTDYYSTRLLSHVLLHCGTQLKVAPLARLLGLSRAAASAQQGLSSKEAVQAAHHRLAGRAHGKLLPRFVGPIAQFLIEQPQASRYELLDFIERTFQVRVSRMALHKFLCKYGLDRPSDIATLAAPAATPPPTPVAEVADPELILPTASLELPATPQPVPLPAEDFFLPPPSTPAPSCCCPPR
jgi:hypothetical protein